MKPCRPERPGHGLRLRGVATSCRRSSAACRCVWLSRRGRSGRSSRALLGGERLLVLARLHVGVDGRAGHEHPQPVPELHLRDLEGAGHRFASRARASFARLASAAAVWVCSCTEVPRRPGGELRVCFEAQLFVVSTLSRRPPTFSLVIMAYRAGSVDARFWII